MDFLKYHKLLKSKKLESGKSYDFNDLGNLSRPLAVMVDILDKINKRKNFSKLDLPLFSLKIEENFTFLNFSKKEIKINKNTIFHHDEKVYEIINKNSSEIIKESISTDSQVFDGKKTIINITYYQESFLVKEINEIAKQSLFDILASQYLFQNGKNLINLNEVDRYKYITDLWLNQSIYEKNKKAS